MAGSHLDYGFVEAIATPKLASRRSDPGVESWVPARATVRVGSMAEPRPDSKAI